MISMTEARMRGLTRYYTGKLCPLGHDCERHVGNRECVDCRKMSNRKYYTSDAGKSSRSATGRMCRRNKPELYRNHQRNREARKRGADGKHTVRDLHCLLQHQGLSCYCGVSFLLITPTIDHIVPISQGGSNWPDNIQLLCQPCNDGKGVKTMEEWCS